MNEMNNIYKTEHMEQQQQKTHIVTTNTTVNRCGGVQREIRQRVVGGFLLPLRPSFLR
jgi:hypothetical protein